MPISRIRSFGTACVLLTTLLLPLSVLADAPHIRNTTPAEAPRTIQLEEIWRTGGDDSEILFASHLERLEETRRAAA